MKIALNFIYKGNEDAKQIYKMLSSAAPHVDGVFATATWTDKEEVTKIIKNFGGVVSFFKWTKDFSEARNYALSQVPEEYDYVLWLDTDDELMHGKKIKGIIEKSKGIGAIFANYNYKIDPVTQEVLIVHPRERVFKRDLYKWAGKLHETAIPQGKSETFFSSEFFVNHWPNDENEKEALQRNLEILEEAYKAEGDKHDPRTEYYLARQYFDMEKWQEAEKLFWDYLKHSGWDEERAMAHNYLAEIYRNVEKYEDAIYCLTEAIREYPFFPTWYINLGVVYGKMQDWDRAIFFTKLGMNVEMPKTAMVISPRDDKVRSLETIYFACFHKRKMKEAFAAASKLLEFFPNDKTLAERVKAVYNINRWTEMSKSVTDIIKELSELGEEEKVEALLCSLPSPINDNAYIEKLAQQYMPPKTWPEKSIVYYCGKGFEKWDESSLKKGIGGSETAVIHLARQWVKAGYKVTVLGYPFEEHIDKYGVEWKQYWRFNPKDTFDIFVAWRNETLLNLDIKARKILLDLHDVPFEGDYTKERLEKVDHIFVKSNYHRSLLPNVPDDKFIIVSNGIDLNLLNINPQKNKYKLIYASSYDRGIDMMLEHGWPIIKKEVPEAELHIYYGWNLFDALYKNNPERMAWKKKILELMSQDGITEHGRIAQKDLIRQKASAAVHYYGTTFEEIDCISVRESAAVGCVPFTTDYAALKEKPYCVKTDGDPYDPETQKQLAMEIAKYLKGELWLSNIDRQGLARKESWENIAKVWLEKIEQSDKKSE